jgi:CheY-like chemotaxis protein
MRRSPPQEPEVMTAETLELPSSIETTEPKTHLTPVRMDRRQTILVVDDDDSLTEVLSFRLERQGFSTLTAHSGQEGLVTAREKRPTLIVLDLRLPDVDGLEICQQLADDPATCMIPVLILSGMETPDILRECRAAGCSYFLRKPYDPNALLTLIRQAIRESEEWDGY